MKNSFQISLRFLVGKNLASHRGTIEIAICVDHFVPETLFYLPQGRFPCFNNLARDDIRVNYWDAKFGKHTGNRRFAAGDTTGQADS